MAKKKEGENNNVKLISKIGTFDVATREAQYKTLELVDNIFEELGTRNLGEIPTAKLLDMGIKVLGMLLPKRVEQKVDTDKVMQAADITDALLDEVSTKTDSK